MNDGTFEAPSIASLAELLPQYGIESFIAQGGMGAVYKGRQLSLDREVAIKVLPKELGSDREFRESFLTEAKAMARLNHPNLLGVFDYGDVDGMPYIVMEYVEGGSLHQAAWNQAIEPMAAVAIVKGICEGLAHAHENGIIHRDIKPSNILLTTKAEPKIADFGLAQATDSAESGMMMGTPGYTAPEVFHDPTQAGQLADIYSVGVILHQLLTGIDPAGCFEPPSKPSGNIRLDAIWRKATHITPAQRHQSIAAMSSDLEKWAAAMQAQQKPAISPGSMAHHPLKRPMPTANTGGGGAFVKVLVIGILLAAAGFTYWFLQDKKEELKGDIAGIGETGTPEPEPVPEKEPTLAPVPEIPVEEEPEPMPGPDIVDTETEDEPEIPPVVDTEPEPEPEPDENLPPGDPELRDRAIGLIADARKKRDKELADNARSLSFSLDSSARDAKPDDATTIQRIKADIVDNLIPVTDGVIGLPNALVMDLEAARAKQATILAGHRSDLTRIRDAYVTRLEGAATEATEDDLRERLLAQAGHAKDLDAWIAQLSPEAGKAPKKSTGAFGGGGFAGKWNNLSDGSDGRWIAHADGKVEVVGKTWKGTWQIAADGTLEVHWPDKPRPYKYKRDDEGWDGETSFGKPTKLTPGDW